MRKKIIYTIFTKGSVAVINFIIALAIARALGTEGRGEISMMFLNVTVVLIFNDIIGGSALVYLSSKRDPYSLLMPAMVTGFLAGCVVPLLFQLYFRMNGMEFLCLWALSLLSNYSSILNYFLNGFGKIKANNFAALFQGIANLSCLGVLFYFMGKTSIYACYISLGAGYLINLFISIYHLQNCFKRSSFSWGESFRAIFSFGIISQAGNIFQLLNYRFCWYVLDAYKSGGGRQTVGVFSTSVSLIESIWIIMNGVAMVQYATLSAMGDAATAAKVTAKWAVNSFILTLMALVILNLLPAGLFSWLFGKGFEEVKTFFPFLSPGIAISGLTGIYAHYFAARGDMRTPALSAFFGLIVTVTLAFILIPVFGAEGAAWTNTFSYLVSGIFLLIMFKIKSGYSFLEVFNIRRVRGETANL